MTTTICLDAPCPDCGEPLDDHRDCPCCGGCGCDCRITWTGDAPECRDTGYRADYCCATHGTEV